MIGVDAGGLGFGFQTLNTLTQKPMPQFSNAIMPDHFAVGAVCPAWRGNTFDPMLTNSFRMNSSHSDVRQLFPTYHQLPSPHFFGAHCQSQVLANRDQDLASHRSASNFGVPFLARPIENFGNDEALAWKRPNNSYTPGFRIPNFVECAKFDIPRQDCCTQVILNDDKPGKCSDLPERKRFCDEADTSKVKKQCRPPPQSTEKSSANMEAEVSGVEADSKATPFNKTWKVILTAELAATIYQQKPSGGAKNTSSTSVKLSRSYGVSPKTIRDIWNRTTWSKATRHLWASVDGLPTTDAPPAAAAAAARPPADGAARPSGAAGAADSGRAPCAIPVAAGRGGGGTMNFAAAVAGPAWALLPPAAKGGGFAALAGPSRSEAITVRALSEAR